MLIVFDLDGTLADDTHRQHHIAGETKDWKAYFEECWKDAPIAPLLELFRRLKGQGCRVEIWTGRPEEYRSHTVYWLSNYLIGHDRLRMRPTGDFRSDVDVKGDWLEECGEARPDLVFEDRTRTVAWWRSQLFTCCQVADHNY